MTKLKLGPLQRLLLASVALLASAQQSTGQGVSPANIDRLEWQTVKGGPGTGCATDATPFEFYVREADSRRVAIYFEGGGACWNSRNCGLDGRRMFDNSIEDADRPWIKTQASGIFDLNNSTNPLREFTQIFVPYCSADIHMGVGTVRYESQDGKSLDVHYRGLANSQSAMDWLVDHYSTPRTVVVAGGSAGAIPSPIFAAQLARVYPRAKVVQIGDGGGGYRSTHLAAPLELWGATRALKYDPLYRDLDVGSANFEEFYTRAASLKNLQLAQINSIEDGVQRVFLAELGHDVKTLAPLLSGNLADIRAVDSRLRSYTMPGQLHTILQRPEFYSTTVDNMPLSQWVGDLVNGRRAGNIGDALLTSGVERLK